MRETEQILRTRIHEEAILPNIDRLIMPGVCIPIFGLPSQLKGHDIRYMYLGPNDLRGGEREFLVLNMANKEDLPLPPIDRVMVITVPAGDTMRIVDPGLLLIERILDREFSSGSESDADFNRIMSVIDRLEDQMTQYRHPEY